MATTYERLMVFFLVVLGDSSGLVEIEKTRLNKSSNNEMISMENRKEV